MPQCHILALHELKPITANSGEGSPLAFGCPTTCCTHLEKQGHSFHYIGAPPLWCHLILLSYSRYNHNWELELPGMERGMGRWHLLQPTSSMPGTSSHCTPISALWHRCSPLTHVFTKCSQGRPQALSLPPRMLGFCPNLFIKVNC